MNATVYTESQIAELKKIAKINKLTYEESIDYCTACHHCGSKVELCDECDIEPYCNERCQSYSTTFYYPCFRGNMCKICTNGSWEIANPHILQPTFNNCVYEIQVWSNKISPDKTIQIKQTIQCIWGVFYLEVTDAEKQKMLENTSYLNTRHTNITVLPDKLYESGNTHIEIIDQELLTQDERTAIREDPDILSKPGWIMNDVYYEIHEGYTIDCVLEN